MRYFLLDTSFLLHLIRNSDEAQQARIQFRLDDSDAVLILSVVTVAEIRVLALRNAWGGSKIKKMEAVIAAAMVVDISIADTGLIDAYITLDTDSSSAGKTMGKNDLWIAATAMVASAELLTFDADFDHLSPAHLKVHKIAAIPKK